MRLVILFIHSLEYRRFMSFEDESKERYVTYRYWQFKKNSVLGIEPKIHGSALSLKGPHEIMENL